MTTSLKEHTGREIGRSGPSLEYTQIAVTGLYFLIFGTVLVDPEVVQCCSVCSLLRRAWQNFGTRRVPFSLIWGCCAQLVNTSSNFEQGHMENGAS